MKKKLIDVIYRIIEILPPRIAEKIKIIGCVIWGDWYFVMRHPEISWKKFDHCSAERINEVYKDLPDDEIKLILRYVQLTEQFSYFPYPENGMLLNYRNIMGNEYSEYLQIQKEMFSEVKKMKLKFPGKLVQKSEEIMYFHHGLRFLDEKVKEYMKGKIFIDAGAFNGDSALILSKLYSPGKICSFEPSEMNRRRYINFMKKNHIAASSYTLYPWGLGAKEDKIYFYDSGSNSCSLQDSDTENEGDMNSIEIKSIDQLFLNSSDKIGLIKADVEGMGLDLVKGATEIIKRDLPVLSLSIYHNEDELLGIYSYLKSMNLEYEYHVRVLSCKYCFVELTLIAFPKK